MNKKAVCSIVRVTTMVVVVDTLHWMYEIGFLGAALVILVSFVWFVTGDIERDE